LHYKFHNEIMFNQDTSIVSEDYFTLISSTVPIIGWNYDVGLL